MKIRFAKYVSLNMLGMLGMSIYILADTYFIAKAVGADGITALNLVLPMYNLIFAIGAMIGVGSAIRFTVEKSRGNQNADTYFTNALTCAFLISLIFVIIGILIPDRLLVLLGGDDTIVSVGSRYTRIFMIFTPFFMCNHICNAFVRNDKKPSVAMLATLLSSLFNIVFDYILMFPLGLGMEGAAIATGFSPVIGIMVCCSHLLSKRCTIRKQLGWPSVKKLLLGCEVGISAFVSEMSSGVITIVFNFLILNLAGNTGVAAYGVVANCSLVGVAVFNGIAQGTQPLVSECYGKGEKKELLRLFGMTGMTAFTIAVLLYGVICLEAENITSLFIHEENAMLKMYSIEGLKIYFAGFLFAGLNIVGAALLSAVESVRCAFLTSIMRGFLAIIVFAVWLSKVFGMRGVWMAFPAAELVTLLITGMGVFAYLHSKVTARR